MAQAPMWLALFPQLGKHFPLTHQWAHIQSLLPHLGQSPVCFPVKSFDQSSHSFRRNSLTGAVFLTMRSLSSSPSAIFLFLGFFFLVSSLGETTVVFVCFVVGATMKLGRKKDI
jgi:hypothetical protein